MKGATHLAVGIACGLTLARLTGAGVGIAGAGAGIAALIPDWLQINVPALGKTIKGAFGHRGFTHWALTAVLVYLALVKIYPVLALPVFVGWLSHLALDTLNDPGIPLLWPLPWRVKLAGFKSGGPLDQAILWLAVVAVVWGAFPYIGG